VHISSTIKFSFEEKPEFSFAAAVIEQQNRLNEAIELWQKALKFGDDADIHFALGKTFVKDGRAKEAEWHFRQGGHP